jgi:hypothetical protein
MAVPQAEWISASMWYLDHGTEKLTKTYTREEISYFLPLVTERGKAFTDRKEFPATPSDQACRWCQMNSFCEFSVAKKKKAA